MKYLLLMILFLSACAGGDSGGQSGDSSADRQCFFAQDESGAVYDQAEGSGLEVTTENNITFICGDINTVTTTVATNEPEELAEFLSTASVK